MTLSEVQARSSVYFPDFTAERVHMVKFTMDKGLPSPLKRWQRTVDQMLEGVDTDEPIFITIDQGFVKAGTTHRRAGIHVDGAWVGNRHTHVHPTSASGEWKNSDWSMSGVQAILLASNIYGCDAYVGSYSLPPRVGGDCSHISKKGLEVVRMEPNRCYAGDSLKLLHETTPQPVDVERSFVRLNVNGWLPTFPSLQEI